MKITWIGHSCFLIEGKDVKVITDPYDEHIPYRAPSFPADVVTVSHEHSDHNAVDRVPGSPEVVRGPGEHTAHGVKFTGIATFHDEERGKKRGENTIFTFAIDGIVFAHFGDLGHMLNAEQLARLADVEAVMIPVGGYFTIDAAQAAGIVAQLPHVKVILPMHYKTDVLGADFPIDSVDKFTSQMQNIVEIGSAEVSITAGDLPVHPEVWILHYA
ncbi:MAG TPA: MBL fold metallo-hydrolase [Candidatus Acetothermia bacterium]|nr:MBL fold metallo-hydrolase [Candidatus Acetothermia bacterium]